MLGVGFGPTLARREETSLLESIPCGSQALHRDVETGFLHSAVREGPQKHGYRPRETVDVALWIGPRIPGPPTADVAIFHGLQDLCTRAWTSIGSKTLFIRPVGSVGQKNRLAHRGLGQLIENILSPMRVSLRDSMTLFPSRRRQQTFPRRPPSHRFARLGDRGDGGACSSLEESLGSGLQCLRPRMPCSDRLRQVLVQRTIRRLQEMGILGDHHGSCLAVSLLCDPATRGLFSSESLTRSPGAMLR